MQIPSSSIWSRVDRMCLNVGLAFGSVCQHSCIRREKTGGHPFGIGSRWIKNKSTVAFTDHIGKK
jgi:hypothetical protein